MYEMVYSLFYFIFFMNFNMKQSRSIDINNINDFNQLVKSF